MGVQVSGATDRGLVREGNGDATWWRHEASAGSDTVVLAVADGMGGPAGEIASSAAINECRRSLIGEITAREAQYRLSAAARAANARVYNLAQTNEDCAGMRASLAVALVLGDRLYVAQLGDCRCYVVRSGACALVTTHQPAAPEEVAPREPEPAEAAAPVEGGEPPAEVEAPPAPVVRAAGMAPDVEVDTAGPFELAAGDVVLLCTDGLVVSEEEIARAAAGEPPERLARTLISLANSAGGPDNVSVLAVRIGAPAEPAVPVIAPAEPVGEAGPAEDAVAPEPVAAPQELEPAPEPAVSAGRALGRGGGPVMFLSAVLAALAVGFAGGMGFGALIDGGGDGDGSAVAIVNSPRPTEAPSATATPGPAAATRTPAASRSPSPASPTVAPTPAIAATTVCADGESPAVELLTSSSLWSVYDIANRYGLAEADLYECDPYINPYAIYPGVTVVLIPCTSETECPETGEP